MVFPATSALEYWNYLKIYAYHSRFGKLLIHDALSVSKDGQHWQLLNCYLFSNMLICVKEKQAGNGASSGKFSLKGSVMIQVRLHSSNKKLML